MHSLPMTDDSLLWFVVSALLIDVWKQGCPIVGDAASVDSEGADGTTCETCVEMRLELIVRCASWVFQNGGVVASQHTGNRRLQERPSTLTLN